MGTELKQEDTKLIVCSQPLMVNSNIFDDILKEINIALESKEPLVILCPYHMDNTTSATLTDLLKDIENHNIAVFTHLVEKPQMNDLINLALVRGISPTNVSETLKPIEHVSLSYKNKVLKIQSGLYEECETTVHPLVEDDSFPLYRAILDQIDELIHKIKHDTPTPENTKDLVYFQKMYNKLYLTQRATVRIGGAAHDNTAAVDVCMDAVGAVRETLRNGFNVGGSWALYKLLVLVFNQQVSPVVDYFAKSFIIAISKLHSDMRKADSDMVKKCEKEISIENKLTTSEDQQYYDIVKCENIALNYNNFEELTNKNDIVIQPASIDPMIIKRFGEVVLKFIYTARIIRPGAVYVESEKQES
jgi:hypothetical protein